MLSAKQQIEDMGFSSKASQKLGHYVALIQQWNKAINLVAPSTMHDVWERHILDSAQLWLIINAHLDSEGQTNIVDIGSGGGLPGLVLAIAGCTSMTMIESDTRKCVFLREVSRETKLENVTVINERIEKSLPPKADFVTARALAPIKQLVEWATPFLKENGKMVFLKGADFKAEMAELPLELQQKTKLYPSLTDKNARIIVI